jgi:hypothetical protein
MQIDYAVLADYAEIVAGKLYLMGGGWDTSHAASFPAHVRLAVGIGVRVGWSEPVRHVPVHITVEDDDGKSYVRLDGTIGADRVDSLPPGTSQLAQLAANLPANVPAAGGYRVHIVLGEGDDVVVQDIPFRVVAREPA